jgi:hypothetical protein
MRGATFEASRLAGMLWGFLGEPDQHYRATSNRQRRTQTEAKTWWPRRTRILRTLAHLAPFPDRCGWNARLSHHSAAHNMAMDRFELG